MWTLNCFETGLAYLWTMSNMVKYRAVSFKKDQIAALYFTMSDIVHQANAEHFSCLSQKLVNPLLYLSSHFPFEIRFFREKIPLK